MNVPLVLTHFLDRAVSLYGNKEAIFGEHGRSYTYAQLSGRVNQLSRGLRDAGVKQGDHVAYLCGNSVEMLEGFYGLYQTGSVMVPLNTRLKPEDYAFILNHSESKLLFVDQELYHLIQPIEHSLETVEKIIVHYKSDENSTIDYDQWLVSFSDEPFARADVQEDDVCSLLYTSGTTGNPKGVMLTHRNNYLHAMSAMHHLRVTDEDVLLHVLPMFHVNGWGSPFYYTANGASQVCFRKTSPQTIIDAIQKYKVTILHMAPAVLNSIFQYCEEHKPVFDHQIRVIVAGSAPPPSFISRVEQELGWEFIQVYGMTETSPLSLFSGIRSTVAHLPDDKKIELKAKAGYSMIGAEVRIVDDHGDEVAHDGQQAGEIAVRSHGVMKGYWKNKEATNEVLRDGYMMTGDMGTIDEHGYVNIVDRKKDVVISGGENISSIEVEGVLYDHPDVLEAAVIAVPHEKWGETPHAYIVLRTGARATEQDIIDFSRSNLAHFKAVTGVTFVDALPKTASGKILKVQIRDDYWDKAGKTGRKVN
ncbi:AMP-dependent synthetase [Sporosarcina sp. P37]|uniref:long-chain-fatty-acid--CoA ligase n=1 Tax=unclassified Sporosarcina TaxID=2647733 RepID=UPI000A17FB88|nr:MULTISPECIES: long-chain-fatty-acid--CoA ligase [unclassified Sporosarcina]ARK24061.1 AMP-dependent synthetase [Sporosarcina sp. P37]PID18548.1 AMP-dependent synthetase [Sporosarcina sp. P35]